MFGNKIVNLEKLTNAGLKVPKFKVVSFLNVIKNYEDFVLYFKKQLKLPKNEARTNILAFLELNLLDITNLKLSTNKFYAIRSAANFEDDISDSFAGQFKTFLNVSSDEVKQKIKECILSLCEENVWSYMWERKIQPVDIRLDVIVQEMVEPDYSGVIFSSNPQGLLNESVIVVGRGIGENVVSEKAKVTSYYYNRNDDLYYYVGQKNYLTKEKIDELIKLTKKVESVLGELLDIEFAIAENTIYVLQARKITTLDSGHPLIMDNSNITESYPGVSLPLTISFAKMIYGGVFEAVCRRLLKDEKELKKHKETFGQMVGACNGRMYYKISNWYELINYLPFSKQITKIWNDMMGVKNDINHSTKVPKKLRIRVAKNFLRELTNVTKNMDWLDGYFAEIEKKYRKKFSDDLSIKETLELFHKSAGKLFLYWDYTLINDMYTFINVGILKKRLGKQSNRVIAKISNLESMKPIEELVKLATIKDELSKEEYQEKFNQYINDFGDRSPEELKLESKTFRTNPELLEADILNYKNLSLKTGSTNFEKYNSSLRKNISRCETGIRNREKSRLNRSRIFGMVRELMLHIGKCLAEQKRINDTRDIFYLTLNEIEKLDHKGIDLRAIVEERKRQYEIFSHLPAYSRLVFSEHEFDKNHETINSHIQKAEQKKLYGTPCSAGKAIGDALVINSGTEKYDTKDKIIVARSTDPGWVFMLARAKGVISEKGSLLSHTAIISRELGIPSVVGVENVTKIIKTGDHIVMDGENGIIEIGEKNESSRI